MPRFPQLLSGALTQTPLTARLELRTVVNDSADGRQYKGADPARARIDWEIPLAALTDDELAAVEALAVECEGRLRTFLFADPLDNLLLHSETFTDAAWTKAPGVTVTAGVADPWQTARASTLVNAGGSTAGIAQTVALPGRMTLCLSAWVRSATGSSAVLHLESGGLVRSTTHSANATWQRIELFSTLDTDAEETTVSVRFPAGASLELVAVQLEAQPAASAYKRTAGAAGLYPNARFADDAFLATSTDVNQHSITVRITAPWER